MGGLVGTFSLHTGQQKGLVCNQDETSMCLRSKPSQNPLHAGLHSKFFRRFFGRAVHRGQGCPKTEKFLKNTDKRRKLQHIIIILKVGKAQVYSNTSHRQLTIGKAHAELVTSKVMFLKKVSGMENNSPALYQENTDVEAEAVICFCRGFFASQHAPQFSHPHKVPSAFSRHSYTCGPGSRSLPFPQNANIPPPWSVPKTDHPE